MSTVKKFLVGLLILLVTKSNNVSQDINSMPNISSGPGTQQKDAQTPPSSSLLARSAAKPGPSRDPERIEDAAQVKGLEQQHPSQRLDDPDSNPRNDDGGQANEIQGPNFDLKRTLCLTIYIKLAIFGLYALLYGFRRFRLLMIILGFSVSYYGLLFMLIVMNIYDPNSVKSQFGLLFSFTLLGLVIAVTSYMIDVVNYFVFGAALASAVSLFVAQFMLDVHTAEDRAILAIVFLLSVVVFSLVAVWMLEPLMVIGSSFVGAIIMPINVGVILGDLQSFEDRPGMPEDRWADLANYALTCGLAFVIGVGLQYFIRGKIIKRIQDNNLEALRGTSFLS